MCEANAYLIKDGKEKIDAHNLEMLRTTMNAFIFDVLGLLDETRSEEASTDKLSGTVELLINMRAEARANKDFATSDKIRDELAALGIQLKDSKEGTSFSLN